MAKGKSSRPLSTHDRKVREIARNLVKEGYQVRADVRGRQKPESIGTKKLVPDIEATRSGRRLIVEVETPASLVTDKEQLKTFALNARQKDDTTFWVVVTKPRKK